VERRGEEGEIRFLYCRFATPTDSPLLQAELEAKKVLVRDAIYYYLSNNPLTFLSALDKQQNLKADIISVINEHVSSAKLSELYFEEYMVRGS
jgi:flagellar FliL protein